MIKTEEIGRWGRNCSTQGMGTALGFWGAVYSYSLPCPQLQTFCFNLCLRCALSALLMQGLIIYFVNICHCARLCVLLNSSWASLFLKHTSMLAQGSVQCLNPVNLLNGIEWIFYMKDFIEKCLIHFHMWNVFKMLYSCF